MSNTAFLEPLINKTYEIVMNYCTEANTITLTDFDNAKHYLGNCTSAATPPILAKTGSGNVEYVWPTQQEQGNNPMRIDTVSANATIAAVKSDEAFQREYLLSELSAATRYEWQDKKLTELRELFNLDAPTIPVTSQALLDAILGGKYTTDAAKLAKNTAFHAERDFDDDFDDGCVSSRYYGITFTDLPTPDRKGYDAALTAYRKQIENTKRQIIVGSPADGLAALLALEAWMPGQNAPSTTTVQ